MAPETTLTGVRFLPARLPDLLRSLRAPHARQVIIRGAGSPCANDDHLMTDWINGVYRARDLLLRICQLCEAVEVRDRTVSIESDGARRIINRPDILLGWYTGARPANRTYV